MDFVHREIIVLSKRAGVDQITYDFSFAGPHSQHFFDGPDLGSAESMLDNSGTGQAATSGAGTGLVLRLATVEIGR
jgi:hypothetical protein